MNRTVVYVALNSSAFGVLLYFKQPLAALFLLLAVFSGLQTLSRAGKPKLAPLAVSLGTIGHYDVDEDGEKSLGLYIQLLGKSVFVDVKDDSLVQERTKRACFLFANTAALERGLKAFLENNPSFRNRSIDSIGLHAENLEQGEVFWEPSGYTLLRGLEFRKSDGERSSKSM